MVTPTLSPRYLLIRVLNYLTLPSVSTVGSMSYDTEHLHSSNSVGAGNGDWRWKDPFESLPKTETSFDVGRHRLRDGVIDQSSFGNLARRCGILGELGYIASLFHAYLS